MGSEVTLISSGEQLVVGIDRDMSQRLSKLLHDEGMTILRRSSAEGIRANGDGTLSVVLSGPGTTGKDVTVDRVLAARRLSNSGGLGLRELGVKMDGASILVNDRMETNLPHLYAIGDVTAGPMWSHKANAEGIIAAENALGQPSRMSYGTIPYCVNTIPQVAWVGLTEEQAEAQQIGIAIGKIPTAFNPMAMILDETAGEIKVIASARHGKILGAHIMAPGAADLINAVAMAMAAEATVGELMQMVPRHPSLGEALVDAAMDVEKRSLHMPKW
jgi:dihydrolipoamide dehydrogenase